jgi:hypothetical protein
MSDLIEAMAQAIDNVEGPMGFSYEQFCTAAATAALAALRETHHLVPKDQEPVGWDCRSEKHPDLNHIHRHGEGVMGQPGWTETPLYALEKRHD